MSINKIAPLKVLQRLFPLKSTFSPHTSGFHSSPTRRVVSARICFSAVEFVLYTPNSNEPLKFLHPTPPDTSAGQASGTASFAFGSCKNCSVCSAGACQPFSALPAMQPSFAGRFPRLVWTTPWHRCLSLPSGHRGRSFPAQGHNSYKPPWRR